jgi:hypothetical protein
MMFVGPVWLTWGLQAPLKTKIEAVTPFALRLMWVKDTPASFSPSQLTNSQRHTHKYSAAL